MRKNSDQTTLLAADLCSPATCCDVVEQACTALGSLDVLVNNAGYQIEKQDITDITEFVLANPPSPTILRCSPFLSLQLTISFFFCLESSEYIYSRLILTLSSTLSRLLCCRRQHYQYNINWCLHCVRNASGLCCNQRRYADLYIRSSKLAGSQRNPRQCRSAWPCIDIAAGYFVQPEVAETAAQLKCYKAHRAAVWDRHPPLSS